MKFKKGRFSLHEKDITNEADELLKEIDLCIVMNSVCVIQCFDPSKRPKAKELPKLLEDLIGRAEINNECLSLISTKSPATSIFSYTKHPHAIYTTRIIKYSKYSEYSASLKIDFANWT
ncbi:unnamed protein product [Rhizophagus irregularis]|nr:unnamed protein product [Rhizophagus irregularis]